MAEFVPRLFSPIILSYLPMTVFQETVRGIPCDVWTVFDDDFYIPGYGIAKTRHRLYFMSKDFTRTLVGEVPHMIPVQRVVYLMEFGRPGGIFGAQSPRVIFNYFDFTVPLVPTLYDFSISQCIPKGKIEARESIQFRFPGTSAPCDLNTSSPVPSQCLEENHAGNNSAVVATFRPIVNRSY